MHKKRKRINCIRIIGLFLIIILMTGLYRLGSFLLPHFINRLSGDNVQSSDSEYQNTLPIDFEELNSSYYPNEELYSPHAILLRLNDHKVIFENKSDEKIYPASLTKIMTAIVAIENISNLEETVTLPEKIFTDLYTANASMAGFLPGEEVTAIDLLYGTLLPSGADASIGLAFRISGSESEFVRLMNKKAKELGMENTHFANATGLHDDNHYTTVKDIAVLLQYALKNETFRNIFTTVRHSTDNTNLHPGGITFYSTLSTKTNTYEFDGGKMMGGKTGYTDEAGLCLASVAEKGEYEYILVTAGAKGNQYTEQFHIMDAFTVYEKIAKK